MPVEILALAASLAFFARMLPQPVRLWRRGVPDGVSPLAAMNSVASDLGWFAYGIAAGLVPVWGTSLVALVPGVWTVWLLRRQVTRRDLVGVAVWLGVIAVAGVGGALVVVLGLSVIVNQGPQVVRAVRQDDLTGIAPATFVLALADATLWGSYGVAVGDAAVIGYGVVMATSAVIVLGRIAWTRNRARASSPVMASRLAAWATEAA